MGTLDTQGSKIFRHILAPHHPHQQSPLGSMCPNLANLTRADACVKVLRNHGVRIWLKCRSRSCLRPQGSQLRLTINPLSLNFNSLIYKLIARRLVAEDPPRTQPEFRNLKPY